ncbi:MAG: hypothetical protein CMM01_04145 [Rhodopirellula sp.]|nr:hypothetical protein [Rhodopirellula sp.]
MPGTAEDNPVNRRVDAKSYREVFKSLPSNGHSFELVLNKDTQFLFGGRSDKRRTFQESKPPESIKVISTTF